jgi:hypothetical protein
MNAGRFPIFEEILGLYRPSSSLSQDSHCNTIGSQQDSVRGLAWEEAIVEASPCLWMVAFHPRSEREIKDTGI